VVGVNETWTCDALSWVALWVKSVAAVAGAPQQRMTNKIRVTATASLAGDRFMRRGKLQDEIKSMYCGVVHSRDGPVPSS
jgi:hypothetical protein